MDYRIAQGKLWREDVRDIIELTSVKMDTYLIVIAVEFGICVMALCEGRMEVGTPRWLMGSYILSLGGAFIYLLMSMWFAMHASVTAKSYKNRILTHHVRLSMPTWAELEAARTYDSSFERVEARQMFRVPFLMGRQADWAAQADLPNNTLHEGSREAETPGEEPKEPDVADASASASLLAESGVCSSADPWGLEARGDQLYELDGKKRCNPDELYHLTLVKQAMPYWQSYDGFARVAMSVGTIQLVHALAYYVLGYVFLVANAIPAAWLGLFILLFITIVLIRIDMSLTMSDFLLAIIFQVLGPLLQALACQSVLVNDGANVVPLSPVAYVSHALYFILLLKNCKITEQQSGTYLPFGFRSVMYMDIFGWIQRDACGATSSKKDAQVICGTVPRCSAAVPGRGPASAGVAYTGGYPVSSRPERQPGAAQTLAGTAVPPESFDPATFVPRIASDPGEKEELLRAPGLRPWRIFCGATSLLICLWCIVGASVVLEYDGVAVFVVKPLLDGDLEELPSDAQKLYTNPIYPLLAGAQVPSYWPTSASHAIGLASAGNWIVVSSPFSLLAARVPVTGRNSSLRSGRVGLHFEMVPPCRGIEGHEIQDVTIECLDVPGKMEAPCHALVLLKQNKRLVPCALPGEVDELEATTTSTGQSLVARLLDGSEDEGNEGLASITCTGMCGHARSLAPVTCAYATTWSNRLMELKEAATSSEDRAGGAWTPSLFPPVESERDSHFHMVKNQRGKVAVVRNHVLMFLSGTRRLNLLKSQPPHGHTNGRRRQGWRMPEARWIDVTGFEGGTLLALSGGAPPKLWEFALPSVLQQPPTTAAEEHPPHRPSFLHRVSRGIDWTRFKSTQLRGGS
jgi:hypothetical protein